MKIALSSLPTTRRHLGGAIVMLSFATSAILAACSGGAASTATPDGGVIGVEHDGGNTDLDAGVDPQADTGTPISPPRACSAVRPDAGVVYPSAVPIEGGGNSYSLVQVDHTLYWSSTNGVIACALDDLRTTCFTQQTIYGAGTTTKGALATDGHLLFYATQADGIVSFNFTGFAVVTILAGPLSIAPSSLVVAGGKVFWTTPSGGIQSCDASNCMATQAKLNPVDSYTAGSLGMTTDGTHLYWSYYSDIYVANLDGSDEHLVAVVTPQPAGLFVDSCNLYWGSYSDTKSLSACALNDCANTITPLAHVAEGYAFGVTADPGEVFFSNHLAGNVYRVALQ